MGGKESDQKKYWKTQARKALTAKDKSQEDAYRRAQQLHEELKRTYY